VKRHLRGVLLDHVLRADLMLTGLAIDSLLSSRRKSSFSPGAWEHYRSCCGKPARRNPRPPGALAWEILANHQARSPAG
jgi:hypothetical protein